MGKDSGVANGVEDVRRVGGEARRCRARDGKV